jgi:hypothetical protein
VVATSAQTEVRTALSMLAMIKAADPRFVELVAETGINFEHLYDYGMGAVHISDFDEDGTVAVR